MGVEFRPGETSDTARAAEEKKQRDYDALAPADKVFHTLRGLVRVRKVYSETFTINPRGTFDDVRPDGRSRLAFELGNTPEEVYRCAQEVMERYPEYRFTFTRDPEGKTFTYTVTRSE